MLNRWPAERGRRRGHGRRSAGGEWGGDAAEEPDEGDLERRIPRGWFADLPGCVRFLWAGVAKYLQTGGIVPSQRFLVGKMIAPVPADYEGRIIELGCGTGALTLRLAARCPAVKILACELNPGLAEHCRRRIAMAGLHRRVSVVSEAAEQVLGTVLERGWSKPDFVISGIPLANIRARQVIALVTAVRQALAEDGMYIQFQHSLLDRGNIQTCFGSVQTVPVLLNFPPAVVYYARR
jgi:phospholipid N-methyltransferase